LYTQFAYLLIRHINSVDKPCYEIGFHKNIWNGTTGWKITSIINATNKHLKVGIHDGHYFGNVHVLLDYVRPLEFVTDYLSSLAISTGCNLDSFVFSVGSECSVFAGFLYATTITE
jgi:hypothetical protein